MTKETPIRILSAILAVIGGAIATYLTIKAAKGEIAQCPVGESAGCAIVQTSDESELLGINVAYLGLAGYVSLFAMALWPGDVGRIGGLVFSLIGFGFSAYLTAIEAFKLEYWCQWCVGSAIVMTVLLIVNAARAYMFVGTDDYDELMAGQGGVGTDPDSAQDEENVKPPSSAS